MMARQGASARRVSRLAAQVCEGAAANVFKDPNADAIGLEASELFSVKGKFCLVTGSTKGIGRMMAQCFVRNGATVFINGRGADLCKAVADEVNSQEKGRGGMAVALPGDLATVAGCKKAADDVAKATAKLHVLVNNAGATWGSPFETYPEKGWDKVMDLKIKSAFFLTQSMSGLMKTAATDLDPARVINISSVDGYRPIQTNGDNATFAYTVANGALNHLTKALARTLSPQRITVNAVCPGVMPTNMTAFYMRETTGERSQESATKLNPLGRFGRTADMAGVAMFLSSPAGAWITGAVIPVDGGVHCHDVSAIHFEGL